MLFFVMRNTARLLAPPYLFKIPKGIGMTNEKNDVATLIELLRMAAERRPYAKPDEISQNEIFSDDLALLEMWPEACRRTGGEKREFPPGVIKLWKESLGRSN
jgi:hypothetical protein